MRFQGNGLQSMLHLKMRKSVALYSAETRSGFVNKAKEIQAESGSIRAVDYLLQQIGLAPVDRDENYFAEALNFHLGLLEAYSGRPEAMAEYIRMSRTMPCGDDDLLFSDHVALSTAMRQHQLGGIMRGIPSVTMACMPRSASGTLTHSLANLLDVPVMHTSIGLFPNYFLAPSWFDEYLQGGAVTQDHIMANDFNRGVLKGRNVRNVFVLIRDPRAAARSQVHWLSHGDSEYLASLDRRICEECTEHFIPWLQSWIDCSHDQTMPFRIHMIKFKDIVDDLTGTVRQIAGILQDEFQMMAPYSEVYEVKETRIHFNQGDEDAWRS